MSWPRVRGLLGALAFAAMCAAVLAAPATPETRAAAHAALKKAVTYYRTHVAAHGGYVYYTSEDLKQRWGEGAATPEQIFVQPPGTPTVGMAYLKAYQATGDAEFLAAARAAARALIYGQLKSGGWSQVIDFNPNGTKAGLYRNGRGSGRNHSSLDDNQTQSAIVFLARLDAELKFQDVAVHEATGYALAALLQAQFPNGAFPQGFAGPVAPQPIKPASYPATWPRTWPNEPYWNFYTLNDGLAGSVSETLLTAWQVYRETRYEQALRRLGDFLVLAQMPDPQPAWAQQYDYDMHPMWARRFEPPAISGLESEDAIRTLLKIHRVTRDPKYLEPIPRALAYVKNCRLPDGLMPRYRELQTNRPLYMNRKGQEYFLTYDDRDLPSHYGWKQKTAIDELERHFLEVRDGLRRDAMPARIPVDAAAAQRVIDALDREGRWVSVYAGERLVGQPKFAAGFRYLSSAVFSANIELLSDYLSSAP